MCLLITCEGAGHSVPPSLAQGLQSVDSLAKPPGKRKRKPTMPPVLTGDEPARWAAQRLANKLSAPLIENDFSPHLIDVRRSLHHRSVIGTACRDWSDHDRNVLLTEIYHPYRKRVQKHIKSILNSYHFAIHLSIRSFDSRGPKGKPRRTDVGLLYDPSCEDEVDLCLDWIDELYDEEPMLRVRRNYPGRGTNDSLTKAMRTEFATLPYLGIDVWLNQAWVAREVGLREQAIDAMAWSLQALFSDTIAKAA